MSSSRPKRSGAGQRQGASTVAAALAQLNAAQTGAKRLETFQLKEEADVYDVVDDEQYAQLVTKRRIEAGEQRSGGGHTATAAVRISAARAGTVCSRQQQQQRQPKPSMGQHTHHQPALSPPPSHLRTTLTARPARPRRRQATSLRTMTASMAQTWVRRTNFSAARTRREQQEEAWLARSARTAAAKVRAVGRLAVCVCVRVVLRSRECIASAAAPLRSRQPTQPTQTQTTKPPRPNHPLCNNSRRERRQAPGC